jgi:hypothetical protein
MFHRRHKKRCPVCKVGWMPLDTEICYACNLKATPGKAEAIATERERREVEDRQRKKDRATKRLAKKVKHPCKSHRIGGVCALSPIDSRCTFSRTKALKPVPVGCGQAIAKKGAIS